MFSLLLMPILAIGETPVSEAGVETANRILDPWANSSVKEPLFFQVFLALAVVLALIFALAWIIKKYSRFGGTNKNRNGMRIAASLPLGGKKMIHVVRIQERNLVLGVSGDRIDLLTELNEEAWACEEQAPSA
ncbi:MAG: flagellar biosynthetic protein FliO, partial [Planctomycetes bacterium]|nr:flagellar biosynthetic protein FliO [Planctomycetota bacterium]